MNKYAFSSSTFRSNYEKTRRKTEICYIILSTIMKMRLDKSGFEWLIFSTIMTPHRGAAQLTTMALAGCGGGSTEVPAAVGK
jgi:hypothetical protein